MADLDAVAARLPQLVWASKNLLIDGSQLWSTTLHRSLQNLGCDACAATVNRPGNVAALSTSDGDGAILIDPQDGAVLGRLPAAPAFVSDSGALALSRDPAGAWQLWSIVSGEQIRSFASRCERAELSADDRLLIWSGCPDGQPRMQTVFGGQEGVRGLGYTDVVDRSHVGGAVLVDDADGLWLATESGEEQLATGYVTAATFAHGSRSHAAIVDGSIYVDDRRIGALKNGTSIRFSRDDSRVVAWHSYELIAIDVASGNVTQQQKLERNPRVVIDEGDLFTPIEVRRADTTMDARTHWSPDGKRILIDCDGSVATVLGQRGSHPIEPLASGPRRPWVSWSPDGHAIALSSPLGTTVVDATTSGIRFGPIAPAPIEGRVPAAVWWGDGERLLTYLPDFGPPDESATTDVVVTDMTTGAAQASFDLPGRVGHIAVHPDGDLLFTGGGAGSMFAMAWWAGSEVTIVRASDGTVVGTLPGHTAFFSPRGRLFAVIEGHPSRSPGGAWTTLYDARTRRALVRLEGVIAAWSPDERWVTVSVQPVSDHNAPAGPTSWRTHELPTGRELNRFESGLLSTAPVFTIPSRGLAGVVQQHRGEDRPESWTIRLHDLVRGGEPATLRWAPGPDDLTHEWGAVVSAGAYGWQERRLRNVTSGASATLLAFARHGQCAAALLDDEGKLEGDASAIYAVRTGGDLRNAAIRYSGPELTALKRTGLFMALTQ
ncbi:MAG: hypothetical protein AAF715_17370 [Myxococcota bacterium]